MGENIFNLNLQGLIIAQQWSVQWLNKKKLGFFVEQLNLCVELKCVQIKPEIIFKKQIGEMLRAHYKNVVNLMNLVLLHCTDAVI